MRKELAIGILGGLTLATLPAVAAAQELDGRWSITVGAGVAQSVNGIYHEGGSGTVLGLPTAVGEREWSDIYGAGFDMRAGVGYMVSDRMEVTGSFLWSRQEAEELRVGSVAGFDLRSQFSESREWGLEGGVRWHFLTDSMVTPYVAGAAGFRRVDMMPATFSVPAAGVVLADTPFYDTSTVPTMGGSVGVQFAVTRAVRLGVEGGLRWSGDLADVEGLAGTGLENLNDSSRRWAFPILGTMSVRF